MVCARIRQSLSAHLEVGFILLFEMFQRFSYFGFQTLLFLFLKHELKFSLSASISLYHVFVGLGFVSPILFMIIADKCLTKYCAIMTASLIVLVGDGLVILAACSAGSDGLKRVYPHIVLVTMLGLTVRSVGLGGLKEVVRSLGGDQFCLPEEEVHLRAYYQVLYYFMVLGILGGILTTPLLRMHVACFGQLYCFPPGFGVAAAGMFLAVVALLCGCAALARGEPSGSVVVEASVCVATAVSNRGQQCGVTWLDGAGAVFTDDFICDVRATLRVLVLFIPLPIFWALYEQQGSLWVYQASRMIWPLNRRLDLYVEPDQMPAVSHMTVFVALPVVESCLYGVCRRLYLCRSALSRVVVGGLLAVIAFVVAVVVELKVEPTYPSNPTTGEATVAAYNTFTGCHSVIAITYLNDTYTDVVQLAPLEQKFFLHLSVRRSQQVLLTMSHDLKSNTCPFPATQTVLMTLAEKRFLAIYNDFISLNATSSFRRPSTDDLPFELEKCDLQLPLICPLYSNRDAPYVEYVELTRYEPEANVTVFMDSNHHGLAPFHIPAGRNAMKHVEEDGITAFYFTAKRGGVYTLFNIIKEEGVVLRNLTVLTEPNTVHMAWQVPQLFIIGLAYFLFPMTLLQFANRQVPPRMKPVVLAVWYLTIACGNFLVAALAFTIGERLLWCYVMYAAMMGFGVVLLVIFFCNYRVVWPDDGYALEQE